MDISFFEINKSKTPSSNMKVFLFKNIIVLALSYSRKPLPAGISLPIIIFSLRPLRLSSFP